MALGTSSAFRSILPLFFLFFFFASPAVKAEEPGAPPESASPSSASAAERAFAAAREIGDLVRRVESYYAGLGSFRVAVERSVTSPIFGDDQSQSGTIHVVGRRLRWEYDAPEGQVAGFDGRRWWFVVPEEEQVKTHEPVAGEINPLGLITGELDLLEVFAVQFSDSPPENGGDAVLELYFREPQELYDFAILEVDSSSGVIHRLEVIDSLGDRDVYRFGIPVRQKPLPPEMFRLVRPQGYEVVDY